MRENMRTRSPRSSNAGSGARCSFFTPTPSHLARDDDHLVRELFLVDDLLERVIVVQEKCAESALQERRLLQGHVDDEVEGVLPQKPHPLDAESILFDQITDALRRVIHHVIADELP